MSTLTARQSLKYTPRNKDDTEYQLLGSALGLNSSVDPPDTELCLEVVVTTTKEMKLAALRQ